MKKLKFVLIPLIFIAMLFVWLFPQLPGLMWAEYFGYERYSTRLLSDRNLERKELFDFKRSVNRADTKIREFWGSKRGRSQIIYCTSQSTFSKLCSSGEGAGCSIGTPWGSWIILNKEGVNPEVIAHEMSHIELMSRLGWWNVKTKIPTWFDEGLALQTDNRFVSQRDSIQRYIDFKAELELYSNGRPVSLNDIESNKQFFGGTTAETRIAYLTAATEVAGMLARTSRKNFISRLEVEKSVPVTDRFVP